MDNLHYRTIENRFGILEHNLWRFDATIVVGASALINLTSGRDTELAGHRTSLPFKIPLGHILGITEISGATFGTPAASVAEIQLFADNVDGLTTLRYTDMIYQKRSLANTTPLIFTGELLFGVKIYNHAAAQTSYDVTIAGFLFRVSRP